MAVFIEKSHDFTGIFQNSPKTIEGKGTKWTSDNQSNEKLLIMDKSTGNPGYFTKK